MDERLTISTHEADRGSAQAADRFRAVATDTGLVDVAVGRWDPRWASCSLP